MQYNQGRIDEETVQLQISVQGRTTPTAFDITEIGDWDVILGIPWLRRWNPQVDWNPGQISWRDIAPMHSAKRQNTRYLQQLTKELVKHDYDINRDLSHDDRRKALEERMKHIPIDYQKYSALFEEELDTGLPLHSHYDHEIVLREGV